MGAFTSDNIREIKNKLGLGNPSTLLGRDFYKWFNRNQEGRIPCCILKHSVGIAVANVTNATTGQAGAASAAFDTVVADTDRMSRVNGDVGLITINSPGIYLVMLSGDWAANAAAGRLMAIYRNGTADITYDTRQAMASAGIGTSQTVGFVDLFTVGETLRGNFYHDSGAATLALTKARLSVMKQEFN